MPRARQACFYPSFRSRQGQALQQPHGDEVSTEQIKPTHRTISRTKLKQIRVLSSRLVLTSKNLEKAPRLQDLPCPPPTTFKALGSNHVRQQILTAGSACVTCPSNTFAGLHPCTTCAEAGMTQQISSEKLPASIYILGEGKKWEITLHVSFGNTLIKYAF